MLLIIRISSGLAVTGTIICMTGICIILKQYIRGQGNLDFEVKLTKNLRFVSTNGLTYYNYDDFSYTDPAAFGGRAPDIKGTTSSSNAIRWTKYTNQMLKYDNEWGNHRFNALVAYEYRGLYV